MRWDAWHDALLARVNGALVLITGDVDCAEVIGILSIFLGVFPFMGYVKILFSFFLLFLLSVVC